MRTLSRDTWLALGLIAGLIIITLAAAAQQSRKGLELPPLASSSSAPEGSRALFLGLKELGYAVSDESKDGFVVPANTRIALLLEPSQYVQDEEWTTLDKWIENGGTLVIAGEDWAAYEAFGHFGFDLNYEGPDLPQLSAQTPLLAPPVLATLINTQAISYLQTDRQDYVTLIAAEAQPVVISLRQGKGRIILCALNYPFSNAGLKDEGNIELVLNLIALGGKSGKVWFDEWHHGFRTDALKVIGPEMWLRYTPGGQALLFVTGVILLTLILRGRSFGRTIASPLQPHRRSPLEYINALANLHRRAGHRHAVLQQYHQALKRQFGRRYRINPTLPDEQYVRELSQCQPDLDTTALLGLLKRLQKKKVNEAEMVKLAIEVTDWQAREGSS